MISSPTGQPPRKGEPAWAMARLWPGQGYWNEDEYLWATRDTNQLVELRDGFVEVLEMPKQSHQLIVQYLSMLLGMFVVQHRLGRTLFAPLRVRLRRDLVREPDVVFMLAKNAGRMGEDAWEGADLVMEVVSEDLESRQRDLVTKRHEYAEAGIAEYWIVDPHERRIIVLALAGKEYTVHMEAAAGKVASKLLRGFEVEVEQVWKAAEIVS